ncbi:MAG: hypothetical protein R3B45_01665 [Bdellovibrionota bacterium]
MDLKKDGNWVRIKPFGLLSARKLSLTSQPYYPIAADFGVDKNSTSAYATIVYTPKEGKAPKSTLTLKIEAGKSELSIISDDDSLATGGEGIEWQYKLSSRVGASVYSDKDLSRSSYLIRHWGDSAVALMGYNNLLISQYEGDYLITSNEEKSFIYGLHLLFGNRELQSTIAYDHAIQDCRKTLNIASKVASEDRYIHLQLCISRMLTEKIQIGDVSLLPVEKENKGGVSGFPLFLLNRDFDPVLYMFLSLSQATQLLLPREEQYYLSYTPDREGLISDDYISVDIDTPKIVEVMNPEYYTFTLDLSNAINLGPLLVSIRNKSKQSSQSVFASIEDFNGQKVKKISKTSYVLSSNKAKLLLLRGRYRITIDDTYHHNVCNFDLEVLANSKKILRCKSEALSESSVTSEDTDVNLKLARAGYEKYLARLEQISISNTDGNLDLTLFPVDKQIKERWEKFRTTKTSKLDLIHKFSLFAKSYLHDRILVLSCPGPGMSNLDYQLAIKDLKPNALQLFGCKIGSRYIDLTNLLSIGIKKEDKPRILTPVKQVELRSGGVLLPRIVPYTMPKGSHKKNNLGNIISGKFALSVAGPISIVDLNVLKTPKNLSTKEINMSVQVKDFPKYEQLAVRVFSKENIVYQGKVLVRKNTERPNEQDFDLKFPISYGTSWLRVELAEIDEDFEKIPFDVILGSTNFLKLN